MTEIAAIPKSLALQEVMDRRNLPDPVPDLVNQLLRQLTGDMPAPDRKGQCEFKNYPEAQIKYLTFLAKYGLVSKAAAYAGVSSETARLHRQANDDFAAAHDEALEIFRDSLENEALRRAIDGWDEPVYQKGELVGTIHRHSERMMELLLKANLPNKYRDNIKVEGAGQGGVLFMPKPLTVDAWEQQFGAGSQHAEGALPLTIETTGG